MKRAIASPEIAEKLIGNGLVPAGSSPQAMTATIPRDVARFGVLAKWIGLQARIATRGVACIDKTYCSA
jgi:tripartite-type tricarboxylate transporter receptor subunit TctC